MHNTIKNIAYCALCIFLFMLLTSCAIVDEYTTSECNPGNIGVDLCAFNKNFISFADLLHKVRQAKTPVFIPNGRPVTGTYRGAVVTDEQQKVIMAYQVCNCNVVFDPPVSAQEAANNWVKLQATGRNKPHSP